MKKRIIISAIFVAISAIGWLVSTKGPAFLIQILAKKATSGTAIGSPILGPTKTGTGGINLEFLQKMQGLYGKNLSPKDLESLKKAQEQLKGIIPQGAEIPSGQKTLNWEDVKNAQQKMQEELKKLSPEELELYKKMQEGQFENATPPEIQGDTGSSSGMGM